MINGDRQKGREGEREEKRGKATRKSEADA